MGVLLNYNSAARWFTEEKGVRLSALTLRRWVSHGKVPYLKVGGRVFFDTSSLESFLAGKVVPAKAATA